MVGKIILKRLWSEDFVEWEGRHRVPFLGGKLEPRTYSGKAIPIRVGTGTAKRAEKLAGDGHKLMLPSVFGNFGKFKEITELYRNTYLESGHEPAGMEIIAPCYVHVREDGKDAWEYWKPYLVNYRKFVEELGKRQRLTKSILSLIKEFNLGEQEGFRRDCDIAGTPDEVISQLNGINEAAGGIDTLLCYSDCGGLPGEEVL